MNLFFQSPFFLGFLSLIAVPLWLHWRKLAQPKTIAFPSLQMLKEDTIQLRGRKRWEQIVLLLVRCLMVILLSLAFARPQIFRSNTTIFDETNRLIVVIDPSISLDCPQRWSQLIAKTMDFLDDLPANTQFGLISAAPGAPQLVPFPAPRGKIDEALGALRADQPVSRIDAAVLKADSQLLQAGAGSLVVVSDLQAGAFGDSAVQEINNPLGWITAGEPGQHCDGWGIETAALLPGDPLPNRDMELRVRLRNLSDLDIDLTMGLRHWQGDQQRETRTEQATVASAGTKIVSFDNLLYGAGTHCFDLSIEEQDDWNWNNSTFFCADLPEPIRVLLISDDPNPILESLLQSGRGENRFYLSATRWQELDSALLAQNEAIIAELPKNTANIDWAGFVTFFKRGKGVWLLPPATDLNFSWQPIWDGTAIGSVSFPREENLQNYVWSEFDTASDYAIELPELATDGFRDVIEESAYRLRTAADTEIIAKLSGVLPALAADGVHLGTCLVSAVNPFAGSGALYRHPLFLPFVHLLVRDLANRPRFEINWLAGEPLPFPKGISGYRLDDFGLTNLQEASIIAWPPGLFRFSSVFGDQYGAIRLAADESKLEFLPLDQVKSRYFNRNPEEDAAIAEPLVSERTARAFSLAPLLLALALAMILAEGFLTRRVEKPDYDNG